jgi:hypothetical protein
MTVSIVNLLQERTRMDGEAPNPFEVLVDPPEAKTRKPKKAKAKVKPKKAKQFTTHAQRVAMLRKAKARKPKKAKAMVKRVRKAKASRPVLRSERMDLRLSKAEKAKLMAKAKATRRTVTSVIVELIEKMK